MNGLHWVLNVGFNENASRVRERTASLALVVDDELVAQLGVGFKLAAMSGPAIDLGASLSVATAAGDALGSFDRNYAELKLGGGFSPMPSVAVILGGGVGMSEGFGTPDWRAFAGARFKFSVGAALSGGGGGGEVDVPKLDIKEAGRISREDVPPPKPTDDDGDGFMSDVDACPSQAETVNGYLDNDGCPDVLPDRDKDGIPDNVDKCPDKPENYNGFEDTDGCPDKGLALVQVGDEGIKILQRVEFATSSDKIQGPKSFQVLDAVVGAIRQPREGLHFGLSPTVGGSGFTRTRRNPQTGAAVKIAASTRMKFTSSSTLKAALNPKKK